MSNKTKHWVIGSTLAAATAISGGFFISSVSDQQVHATAQKEGFTPKPTIPVKGDVPTIAFGTTVYPNGVKVKMSDPAVTKKQGLDFLKSHMDKDAVRFNKTLQNVKLSQDEYDLYFDFTYQYGIGAWSNSSMLRNLKVSKYKAACDSLLKYKFVAKRDCSVRSSGCYGVWTRQVERHSKCIGANT